METYFQKLISFDQNILAVILLIAFYTLEQLLNNPFKFQNRPRHLLYSVLLPTGAGLLTCDRSLLFTMVL
jgi:hypothetical protein